MNYEETLREELVQKKRGFEQAIQKARNDWKNITAHLSNLKEKIISGYADYYMGNSNKESLQPLIENYQKHTCLKYLGAEIEGKLRSRENFSRLENQIAALTKKRHEYNKLKNAIQYGAENREKCQKLSLLGSDVVREIPYIHYVTNIDTNIQKALELSRELKEEEQFNHWLKAIAERSKGE